MPFIDRVAFCTPTLNNKKIKNLKFPLAKWARLWHYIWCHRKFDFRENFMVVLDSSMVEHAAVNRGVVGSSPTRGAWKSSQTLAFAGFVYPKIREKEFWQATCY